MVELIQGADIDGTRYSPNYPSALVQRGKEPCAGRRPSALGAIIAIKELCDPHLAGTIRGLGVFEEQPKGLRLHSGGKQQQKRLRSYQRIFFRRCANRRPGKSAAGNLYAVQSAAPVAIPL